MSDAARSPGPEASDASGGVPRTGRWEFWLDRGGTFTDCIGVAPDGVRHIRKVLSSDAAPVEAIRDIWRGAGVWAEGAPVPACSVRMGTTVATNALLERRGVPTAFVTVPGFADVVRIGTQERPELFALAIDKPPPLHAWAYEIPGRIRSDGSELEAFDAAAAQATLRRAREAGAEALAIAGPHATVDPSWEERVAEIAREVGFRCVSTSAETVGEVGLLARAETACADAYLTPLLVAHGEELAAALPGAQIRFMQSSGGLTEAARFRGPGALLSGPAGGVVGAARVARQAGIARAIGFDMGGTSTDVSLVVDGETDRVFESVVAGVRVRAPMLRIHTVAAGGGSLCRFDGFRLTVGPESAGARPGPLCYGDPDADALALTDVNAFLGRIRGDRFPFPLAVERVDAALDAVGRELAAAGLARAPDEIAAGFVEIANANMAAAIQEVSVGRGVDPRGFALVGFGGAAGQHVCGVARLLGMRRILMHPLAGLLSAYGIGAAETTWDGTRDAGQRVLAPGGAMPEACLEAWRELEGEGRHALAAEGCAPGSIRVFRTADLRYVGSETALQVRDPEGADWVRAFEAAHEARFGYRRQGRTVEVTAVRLQARAPGRTGSEAPGPAEPVAPERHTARALRQEVAWFPGVGRVAAPVYERESLTAGAEVPGPALVLEGTGTIVIDPGFHGTVSAGGLLTLEDVAATATSPGGPTGAQPGPIDLEQADPVRLEVFGNRFMSIAEQMGAVLRNTAVSTNIKERLDYSCAVFDRDGGLVANAPHIPVHLGAMGATVRAVREAIPDLGAGDAIVTNDPACGGSHLPDVTVVSPVFVSGRLEFFVASRGHHADIGGITPGSMPAHSRRLEEEGVVLRPFPLVRGGRFDEDRIRAALAGATHPARTPDDNVADLEAQVAANRAGAALLDAFVDEVGRDAVAVTMRQLQEAAAAKVAREIARLEDGDHTFSDCLDDGTGIRVRLRVAGDRMAIDFGGTAPAVAGNTNAPRAVVESAVIYVLRCLVAERIPLNGGCLAPVALEIPSGSLLDPPPGAAVVGGNVETSQRVVDVLLGAIGQVAASQGTMNNLTFGNADFGYYETIGGGAGATASRAGASGVHTHMTNTRITDIEVLERRAPVVVREFAVRAGSGGRGAFDGGDGLVRELEFTAPVEVSLLTERRTRRPYGVAGGAPGEPGRNTVLRRSGEVEPAPGNARLQLEAGDRLRIETPGGGGFGTPT